MRNRRFEWRFQRRTIRIGMNPLHIFSDCTELIDSLLINQ
ncbi:Uncharacterised protein [Vibrio cholerae]|nr:Uncharacterised protein [Vibrio cholerae]CSB49341.1 Uncharacterised protein [Vibrio cholerae]CSB75756.1 Uncharacterised protein [Vibrio cholerae]CSC73740.1 Uncharacterised protein [Vibrio cholerae]